MARNVFTLRLPSEDHAALETLSKVEGRPMNQLLNDAVKSYLLRVGPKEKSIRESLDRLKAYRKVDPNFHLAAAAFIEGELHENDPAEGVLVKSRVATDRSAVSGPAQKKIRELLNA